jgi:hypothetical protein
MYRKFYMMENLLLHIALFNASQHSQSKKAHRIPTYGIISISTQQRGVSKKKKATRPKAAIDNRFRANPGSGRDHQQNCHKIPKLGSCRVTGPNAQPSLNSIHTAKSSSQNERRLV